ncbi:MAG: hypothetical protein ACLUUJ_03310, partial [Acutalibacteraceae bacterium]
LPAILLPAAFVPSGNKNIRRRLFRSTLLHSLQTYTFPGTFFRKTPAGYFHSRQFFAHSSYLPFCDVWPLFLLAVVNFYYRHTASAPLLVSLLYRRLTLQIHSDPLAKFARSLWLRPSSSP